METINATECLSDFPHRGSDLDAFLSIKPRISFAEEFEEVLVLVA